MAANGQGWLVIGGMVIIAVAVAVAIATRHHGETSHDGDATDDTGTQTEPAALGDEGALA